MCVITKFFLVNCVAMLVIVCEPSMASIENGQLNGKFSEAEGRQVVFSRGNFQYQASSNTWRFAEHRYDVVWQDNKNISEWYSGWIDLFG